MFVFPLKDKFNYNFLEEYICLSTNSGFTHNYSLQIYHYSFVYNLLTFILSYLLLSDKTLNVIAM